MRKKFLCSLMVILVIIPLFSKEELLKIPLRVYKGSHFVKDIKRDSFTLMINGEKENSFWLDQKLRSISKKDAPLKYFILDFNIFNYYKDVEEVIDYFVDNILIDEPFLVATREKIYVFFHYNSKAYLKSKVKKVVKGDTIRFEAETKSYYRKFKKIIKQFTPDKEGCTNFIERYQKEWEIYKVRYVYPDMRKYQLICNLLANKEGDKYLISFQHRQIIPLYEDVQKIMREMYNFVSSAVEEEDQIRAAMISNGISNLKKSFLLSSSFPLKSLTNLLLSNNIVFDLVFFNNKMKNKSESEYSNISPDMEKLLREVSLKTGGSVETTDNLIKALDKIVNHEDLYYLISLKIRKVKDLKIKLKALNKSFHYYYPDEYKKNFIKNLFILKRKMVKIENFTTNKKQIGFSISNFKMVKKGGKTFGVLKVSVLAFDKTGKLAYKTGNLLNSVKKSISIKLPPVYLNGNFKLYITVRDLIGESSTIFEKEVKF